MMVFNEKSRKNVAAFFGIVLGLLPTWFLIIPKYTGFARPLPGYIVIETVIYCIVCIRMVKHGRHFRLGKLNHPVLAVVLCAGLAMMTLFQMHYARLTGLFAVKLHMPVGAFTNTVAILSCILAVPGMDFLLSWIWEAKPHKSEKTEKNFKVLAWFAISAAVILLVCTKNSPLYPLNNWYDLNCFFTIGRGMRHGLMPYRDLIDQKGPLFYMLFYLAALVSEESYFGVFLLEWICCTAFMYLCWEILRPSCSHKVAWIIPLFSAVLYSVPAFTHGGSAEEICLPLIMYGLMVGYRAMSKETLPGRKEFFLIGVTSGAILWIKYTMLGFYIGWIIVPFVLAWKQRRLQELLCGLGHIALGVLVIGAVPILYLLTHGALNEMLQVYFYDTIFKYSAKTVANGGPLGGLFLGCGNICAANHPAVILIMLGIVRCCMRENRWVTGWFIVSTGFLGLIQGYCGGSLIYYGLIMTAMAPFGMVLLWEFLEDYLPQDSRRLCVLSLGTALASALVLSPNCEMLFRSKVDTPQGRFAADIAEAGLENPRMLNYGFLDGGFYTAAGILPNEPFFMQMNMMYEETEAAQRACIRDGRVDFIVTVASNHEFEGFELVDAATTVFEEVDTTYYLYARSGLLIPRLQQKENQKEVCYGENYADHSGV